MQIKYSIFPFLKFTPSAIVSPSVLFRSNDHLFRIAHLFFIRLSLLGYKSRLQRVRKDGKLSNTHPKQWNPTINTTLNGVFDVL